MSRTDRITLRLDDWRFWVGVAYFGIAAVVLGLYVLFSRQTNETAKRVAIQRANAQAQVSQCANAVRNAPVVDGFAEAHHALIVNQILTTTAALQVAAPGDPLTKVRLASLRRLEVALTNANQLLDVVSNSTPTKAACNREAAMLGVPVPFPHLKGTP